MINQFKIIKLDKYLLVLLPIIIIFFLLYSWLPFSTLGEIDSTSNKLIFNSPDETANFWSAYNFYQHSSFSKFSQSSIIGGDIISPRSFRIIDNYLVPVGFSGLPLIYGLLAKVFSSYKIILFLTPFFALLGVLFFYLLIKHIFTKRIAFISALLLLILPGYWYYANKSLMPNTLFISLLIMALYFFVLALNKNSYLYYILAGLFTGSTLLVRTSEVVWLLPLFILICLFNFKKINNFKVALVPIFAALVLLPMLYLNTTLFNSPFSIGYQITNGQEIGYANIWQYILPFGFDLAVLKYNAVAYLKLIFPWLSALMAIATIFFIVINLKKNQSKKMALINGQYLFLAASVSFILIIFYGSWQFSDSPNPNDITIGNSFVRYWMPIFILALPIIAYGFDYLFKKSAIAWKLLLTAGFCILFVLNFNIVFKDKQEGLLAVKNNIDQYKYTASLVITNTPANSIIVAKKSDKIFFPTRDVIYDLFYDIDYIRVKKLTSLYPVYLWDFQLSDESIKWLNDKTYSKYDLTLVKTANKYNKMQLYRLEPYDNK